MTKEIINFNFPNNDPCSVLITELNHNVVSLQPTLTLSSPFIDPLSFHHVAQHVSHLNKPYIKYLYFENFVFNYKIISFNIFGHITSALKNELRLPININLIKSNQEDYSWIESDFLPKFCKDIDKRINYVTKKSKCAYTLLKKGKLNDTSFSLSDTYDTEYNYVYEIHPTDIAPLFETYIKTSLTNVLPNDHNIDEIKSKVKKIFKDEFEIYITI